MTYTCLKTKSKQVDFQSFNQLELHKEPHLLVGSGPSPNVLAWPVCGTQVILAPRKLWLQQHGCSVGKKKKKTADLSSNLRPTRKEGASDFHLSSGLHTRHVCAHSSHTIKHFFKDTGQKVESQKPACASKGEPVPGNKQSPVQLSLREDGLRKDHRAVWLTRSWQGVVSQKVLQ